MSRSFTLASARMLWSQARSQCAAGSSSSPSTCSACCNCCCPSDVRPSRLTSSSPAKNWHSACSIGPLACSALAVAAASASSKSPVKARSMATCSSTSRRSPGSSVSNQGAARASRPSACSWFCVKMLASSASRSAPPMAAGWLLARARASWCPARASAVSPRVAAGSGKAGAAVASVQPATGSAPKQRRTRASARARSSARLGGCVSTWSGGVSGACAAGRRAWPLIHRRGANGAPLARRANSRSVCSSTASRPSKCRCSPWGAWRAAQRRMRCSSIWVTRKICSDSLCSRRRDGGTAISASGVAPRHAGQASTSGNRNTSSGAQRRRKCCAAGSAARSPAMRAAIGATAEKPRPGSAAAGSSTMWQLLAGAGRSAGWARADCDAALQQRVAPCAKKLMTCMRRLLVAGSGWRPGGHRAGARSPDGVRP